MAKNPDETLAALTAKAEECRELLSDMRSMDKTLRRTIREAGQLVAATMDEELERHIIARSDEVLEFVKKDALAARDAVQARLESQINATMRKMERAMLDKIANA